MGPEVAHWLVLGHGGLVILLSIATFTTYGVDKRRSKKPKARRVSERTLHRLSWFGGVAGAWLGRRLFRHKTRKRGFTVRLVLAAVLHLVIAGSLVWLAS